MEANDRHTVIIEARLKDEAMAAEEYSKKEAEQLEASQGSKNPTQAVHTSRLACGQGQGGQGNSGSSLAKEAAKLAK